MSSCTVASCRNHRRSTTLRSQDISYHRFPRNDEMREKWVQAVQPKKTINDNNHVCSVHFSEEDFERSFQAELLSMPKKKRLKPTAVPSLHIDVCNEGIELTQDKKEILPFVTNECTSQESTESTKCITSEPDVKYKAIIQRIDHLERQNYELLSSQNIVVKRKSKRSRPLIVMQDSEDNETELDIDSTNSSTVPTYDTNRSTENTEYFLEESTSVSPEISQDGDDQKLYLTDEGGLRCRTCLDLIVTQRFYFLTVMGHLTKTIKEMIIFCIPQMASTLCDADVVCEKCLDAIQFCVKFIESCLEVEEKIQTFDEQEKVSEYDDFDDDNLPDTIDYVNMDHDYVNMDHDYVMKGEPDEADNDQNLEVSQPSILETLLSNQQQPTCSNSDENYTDTNQQTFKCPNCERILKSRNFLVNHIKSVHSNLILTEDAEKDLTVSNCTEEANPEVEEFLQIADREKFKCPSCSKLFKTENYLAVHMRRVHDVLKGPTVENIKDVPKKVDRRHKYICEFCKTPFVRQGSYRRHLKKHNEKKSDTCRICGLKFHNKEELIEHRRQHGVVCSVCFKGFSTRQKLNDHRQIHPDIYFCEVCGKGFKIKSSLTVHAAVHNPDCFHCNECGRGFKSKSLLKYHEIIHDPEKKIKCDKCSSTFQDKTKLNLHRRVVHEKIREFQCLKCDRKFGLKIALKYHDRLTHLKLRTFQCEICGKSFGRRNNLTLHTLRRHRMKVKKENLTMETESKTEADSEELEIHK